MYSGYKVKKNESSFTIHRYNRHVDLFVIVFIPVTLTLLIFSNQTSKPAEK